ncbi:Fanconi anemia group F protein [Amblyraja radiata]|uniref:Fanconi anemia group F protein n=1 Tax=Amblyraja radiata TaxID=386614 RepID=UPI0014029396|nr:Fanconi anemia group F protein [Amblyraja radiata]
MEETAVVEAAQRFAEVLAVARSPWAADWDTATVGRAFQWARYLEQLSHRLERQGQGEAWRRLQLQLRPESRAPMPHPLPGFRGLGLEELGRGRQMLGQALLCNPASSAAAFHRAAAWYRAGCGEEQAAAAAALRRAARLAAAARVLQLAGGNDTERAARVTQAEVWRERRGELPEEAVWRRAVSADAGCWRPLAALLTAADGDEPPAARPGLPGNSRARPGLLGDSAARPALPGDSRTLADAACRALPCPLLSELAALRPPFARRYTAHLQRWAARMQYDAGSGRWLHPDSPEQDWEKLLQHFTGLLQGPPATKESTLRTLNSLKAADGDFEVWGISVWTDLLLALKQQKVV